MSTMLHTLTVLVVDDDRDAADSTAALVSLNGHSARTAYSGDEALAAARDGMPDVVLLDLSMPGMSGEEVARRLRDESSGVVLVAVTGYGADADREATWRAGFDLHLVKPVEPVALAAVLEEYARR